MILNKICMELTEGWLNVFYFQARCSRLSLYYYENLFGSVKSKQEETNESYTNNIALMLNNLCTQSAISFFLINWNTKLQIKFWFLFLSWNWDIKHETNSFFDFQNNRTLKFKLKVRFWKTKNQICLNKYLMRLVTRSHYAITINKYKRIKWL